jgi:predicted O-methyltransferase YrrM
VTAYPAPREAIPPDAAPTTDRFGQRAMRWNVISQLVHENGWTAGVEIGTADGRCTEAVLAACPNLHMTTVDLWAAQPGHAGPEDWADWPHLDHERRARARLAPFADRCTIIKGYSKKASDLFEPASLDFVFLDGDHGEYGVRTDIMAWKPKIRLGGMLLGHDSAWAGVRAAIDDLCPGYWIAPNDVWGVVIEA